MYYATIMIEWAGTKSFNHHLTQTTEGVETPGLAQADAWDYIDQYMRWYPLGGYRARFWVCKKAECYGCGTHHEVGRDSQGRSVCEICVGM